MVFRPNIGRILGAVVLMLLTPVAVVDGVPFVVGGIGLAALFAGPMSQGMSSGLAVQALVWTVGPLLVWYPASALIVSGVRSRWMRFGLFSLMFWSAFSAVVLVLGATHWR